ncbi:ABC transporter ATP-binding protein [Bombilactobacillus thymidiniphilus]|uniref:ABC transporter ATP-binding protein/permease n=1 Tax=Bombilactobacillus thymidiniphilus TaxID=2923363 RepID=A0ABY4PDP3_9LACO|nr:ABC transporter ATP-binding protein [Bombilactobacillus thymidiniphilus]UQS83855.1 ABC transporter ATP-binding protein/permease [Bombilactobacillus thymidiniphilus]
MLRLLWHRISYKTVLGALFFMVLQVIGTLYLPNITANIVNNGIAKSNVDYIIFAGIKMTIIAVLVMAAAYFNVWFAAQASQKLGRDLRNDIYQKVLYLDNDEFDKIGTSSLITRTTNDVMQIQNVTIMFLRMMIMAPIMMVGASLMAYQKDPRLTKIFVVVLPLLLLVMAITLYFADPLFKAMQKKTDRLNLIFREGLTGVRVIRAFRQDNWEQERFVKANKDYTNNAQKVFSIMALMSPITTLIMSGTNIAITWIGAKYIAAQQMPVGNLLAFMTYANQILISCMMLTMIFVVIPRAQASSTRIQEILQLQNTIVDAGQKSLNANVAAQLSFENVYFSYQSAQQPTLQNINFTAQAGQTVGIIGSTGAGKTTLVNLINRFYDADSGKILVNGQDVCQVKLSTLNEQVALTQQKAFLFKGTIRENLLYGNPKANDAMLWHALKVAQAAEFVQADHGLETVVEQGGNNFSGGQKQRLAIARTLVKQAAIYIFDDSFSALDFKTDALLRQALKNDPQMKNKICVIVGQRISTIASADVIVVLDQGQMVGCGTHEQLKANNSTYQEIINSQIKGDK